MSTDLVLMCVDHEPYIQSEDVGSNLSYLPKIRQAYFNREAVNETMRVIIEDTAMSWPDFGSSYENTLRWFLYAHPTCTLELWDEYGRYYPWVEGPAEKPLEFDTTLGTAFDIEETSSGIVVSIKDLTPEGQRLLNRLAKKGSVNPISLFGKDRL